MTSDIRTRVLELVAEIAPEADVSRLDPEHDLREELDLDSMDFLNLVIAVHRELGVEIPEADYGNVRSLAAMADYVARARSSAQG